MIGIARSRASEECKANLWVSWRCSKEDLISIAVCEMPEPQMSGSHSVMEPRSRVFNPERMFSEAAGLHQYKIPTRQGKITKF
jgi:hypothetical protein